MRKTVLIQGIIILTGVIFWSSEGKAASALLFQEVSFEEVKDPGREEISSEADTLGEVHLQEEKTMTEAGNGNKVAAGFLGGLIQSGSNSGPGRSDFYFGVSHRQLFGDHFFGEAMASIGMMTDDLQKVRLIPAEYRLNYSFNRGSLSGSGRYNMLSPYLFVGVGLLYHKPIEITPPLDPRTGRLEGRLPSSSLFDFDDGLTPVIPAGIGLDVHLDSSVMLNLQVGYHRVINKFALHGEGFRNHYVGFTVGLNFRRTESAEPVSRPQPAPRPIADVSMRDESDSPAEETDAEEGAVKPLPPVKETPDRKRVTEDFPPGLPMDTVESGKCRYSVQVGSFQTMDGAVRVLEEATAKTGYSFDIWYNRRNRMYMVRSRPGASLGETVSKAENVERTTGLFDVAVLHQCDPDPGGAKSPHPLQYQVQIAAFESMKNAVRYAADLRGGRRMDIVVRQSEDSAFYRVKTKPYETIFEARQAMKLLQSMGLGKDLFLTATPEMTRFSMDFEYSLQVGMFLTEEEAAARVSKLQSETDYPFRVLTDEQEQKLLFVDMPEADWIRLMKVKLEILDLGISPTVLHLIEK